jgi:hypothetical protein
LTFAGVSEQMFEVFAGELMGGVPESPCRQTAKESEMTSLLEVKLGASLNQAADDEILPDSISRRMDRSTDANSSRVTWLLRN